MASITRATSTSTAGISNFLDDGAHMKSSPCTTTRSYLRSKTCDWTLTYDLGSRMTLTLSRLEP